MIAVISDSHIPSRADKLPEKVIQKLKEADKVVHCGDIVDRETYNRIQEISNGLIAVKGNCERFELTTSKVFSLNGTKFGAYHGTGISPRGHHPTLVRVANDLEVDILFHGHTHRQEAVEKDGKILLNPGSCTGVGGGSSDSDSPKMMTVQKNEDLLEVKLMELSSGRFSSEKREFEL